MQLEKAHKILEFCAKSFQIPQDEIPVLSPRDLSLVDKNAKGAFTVEQGVLPVIYLDLDYSDVAWTITHEFVHFLQWFRGDLTVNGNILLYKNQDNSGIPYYSRPEEKEAREIGESLWRSWNRQNRG